MTGQLHILDFYWDYYKKANMHIRKKGEKNNLKKKKRINH